MFSLDEVEVLGVERNGSQDPDAAAETWPCPACGDRSSVRDAYEVRVRNRSGKPMERSVLVCRSCLFAANREPWLEGLPADDLKPQGA